MTDRAPSRTTKKPASGQTRGARPGNTLDAAVSAAFVLHEPHLNGPGGDLAAIFTTATEACSRVLRANK